MLSFNISVVYMALPPQFIMQTRLVLNSRDISPSALLGLKVCVTTPGHFVFY